MLKKTLLKKTTKSPFLVFFNKELRVCEKRNHLKKKGYKGIQRDTKGYKGIQRDTKEYKGIQKGYKGIQRDTKGYKGIRSKGCSF